MKKKPVHRKKNAEYAAAYGASSERIKKWEAKPLFERDERKTNPGLHRLYVEWAVKHLAVFEKAIQAFSTQSNLNALDGPAALFTERDKLIQTNAAYAEADKLIKIYCSVHPIKIDRELEYNVEIDKG